MRVKPDGTLDGLDHWREAPPAKTDEELRKMLVDYLPEGSNAAMASAFLTGNVRNAERTNAT